MAPLVPSPIRIRKVVCGGETGADQGDLIVAPAARIETGGRALQGWETEDRPAPWLVDLGLDQCETPAHRARPRAQVWDSDATLWFGLANSPSFWATRAAALNYCRPFLVVWPGTRPREVVAWFAAQTPPVEVLDAAGDRESRAPEFDDRTRAFLMRVLRLVSSSAVALGLIIVQGVPTPKAESTVCLRRAASGRRGDFQPPTR